MEPQFATVAHVSGGKNDLDALVLDDGNERAIIDSIVKSVAPSDNATIAPGTAPSWRIMLEKSTAASACDEKTAREAWTSSKRSRRLPVAPREPLHDVNIWIGLHRCTKDEQTVQKLNDKAMSVVQENVDNEAVLYRELAPLFQSSLPAKSARQSSGNSAMRVVYRPLLPPHVVATDLGMQVKATYVDGQRNSSSDNGAEKDRKGKKRRTDRTTSEDDTRIAASYHRYCAEHCRAAIAESARMPMDSARVLRPQQQQQQQQHATQETQS